MREELLDGFCTHRKNRGFQGGWSSILVEDLASTRYHKTPRRIEDDYEAGIPRCAPSPPGVVLSSGARGLQVNEKVLGSGYNGVRCSALRVPVELGAPLQVPPLGRRPRGAPSSHAFGRGSTSPDPPHTPQTTILQLSDIAASPHLFGDHEALRRPVIGGVLNYCTPTWAFSGRP